MFAHVTMPSIIAFFLFFLALPLSSTALPVTSSPSVLALVNAASAGSPASLLGRVYNPAVARSAEVPAGAIAARTPEPEHPIADPARALAAASAVQPLRRAERFMLRMARAGALAL